jgi:hypothetical protein
MQVSGSVAGAADPFSAPIAQTAEGALTSKINQLPQAIFS